MEGWVPVSNLRQEVGLFLVGKVGGHEWGVLGLDKAASAGTTPFANAFCPGL